MKTKTLLFFLFLTLISNTASSQKIIRLAKKGFVTQCDYYSEIPFRYENKHIFIDVMVNGEVYNFLFDTGFDFSAVDTNHIKNINYKKVLKKSVSGSSFRKQKIQFIEIPTIRISNIEFNVIGASIIDLSFVNKDYPCFEKPISGIIGANILRKANWQIDYKKRVIVFSDNLSKFNISGKAFKADILSEDWRRLLVRVKINGIDKIFTIDTGSDGKITTGIKFQKEIRINNKNVRFIPITRKRKDGQIYDNYYAFIEQICIGDLKLTDQIMSLEKGVSSLIGNKLLENFIISIDWENNKLFLDPLVDINKDSLVDYQLTIKPNYTLNNLEISGLYKENQKIKSNLIGSKITMINDINVSNISTKMLCDFWSNEWEKIKKNEKILIKTEKESLELVKIYFIAN